MNIKIILVLSFNLTCFKLNASVEQLFLQSLKKSKQVKIINLEREKTLLNLENRVNTIYPEISVSNYNKYGDQYYQNYNGLKKINSSLAISLEQKLFQGGSEFALLDLKKIIPEQAKSKKNLDLSMYFAQFSNYYFQVSAAIEERDAVKHLLNNLEKRVNIVRNRAKIGRDRSADLLALESQLARLKSDLFSTQIQIDQAKTNFFNFSELTIFEFDKDKINPLELNLSKNVNLESRPELENLKFQIKNSEVETRIKKAAYLPQISMESNFHIDKSYSDRNNWDISINLTMPIYDFGSRNSSVQTSHVETRINQAKFQYNLKSSQNTWLNYVNSFELKKSEFLSLKKALQKSKESYKEQLKDVNKGLITQIEVIRSLDDVINLEKLVIKSALNLKLFYYQANAYLGNYPKSE